MKQQKDLNTAIAVGLIAMVIAPVAAGLRVQEVALVVVVTHVIILAVIRAREHVMVDVQDLLMLNF